MIAAIGIGVGIGLTLGALGAGGAILAVPALVYGAGQPLDVAIPMSLSVVAVASLGALLPGRRRAAVRWRIALAFAAAGVPATFGGAALGRLLPQRWLLLAFAGLMVAVGVRMLRGGGKGDGGDGGEDHAGACRASSEEVNWRRCLPKVVLAGAAVGVLTGLFGVGGGFVVVPALGLLLGLTPQQAVATSLVVVAANSLSGLVAHADAISEIDPAVFVPFGVATLVAAIAAGGLASRLAGRIVRKAFAVVVLGVAAFVAVAAIVAPQALG
ncbi:sulfite exporter TauE/SafE family protein [Saccharomonospora xinjiangensis]|uniref:sulfite exporter TauE/SafE family protein n=1 Tax=Saccharomonospora xinjiangensis TaxID=75294 RepID=UPI00106FFCDE|nr:sulfite exporter TauE/SafE family protein [Saccharomonospora xinjiangensis]QBQ60573.1 Sulfite exporter TauE/SafE [Saccharomonospora xinjiangensis]